VIAVYKENKLGEKGSPLFLLIKISKVGVLDPVQADLASYFLSQDVREFCLAAFKNAIYGDMLENDIVFLRHFSYPFALGIILICRKGI
jgi:hypothetical protein